jgi:hypothetical protein
MSVPVSQRLTNSKEKQYTFDYITKYGIHMNTMWYVLVHYKNLFKSKIVT